MSGGTDETLTAAPTGAEETLTAAPAGADEPLRAGKSFGRYAIERVLGQGGMGIVYAAHDPDLDRPVALKLLLGRGDDFARARLLREARAMARLTHPNVVTVFEVATVADRDFVAMELIDGTSIDRWVKTPRTLGEIVDVFVKAGRGLAAAHDKGLVHRDFKPHNVLVGRDGRVVVTDFGLARAAGTESADASAAAAAAANASAAAAADADAVTAAMTGPIRGDEETIAVNTTRSTTASTGKPSWSTTLTATGALLGTPAYMAPEQWKGASADPRSDQFAFCVSLWEAVAGERPFRGEGLQQLRAAASGGPPPAPKGMPAWLAPILRRGLAVEPAGRWPSMHAVVGAIEHGRGRGRRRAIAAGVIGVLLVGGGATAFAVGGGGTSSATRATVAAGAASAPIDSVCQRIDDAVAGLWSPERRMRERERMTALPELATFIDRYYTSLTGRWRDAYARACEDKGDRQRLARVACLEGWRDATAALLDGLTQVPVETMPYVPVAEITPAIEACTAAIPVMPPPAPTAAQRELVRAIRVQNFVIGFSDASADDQRWLEQRKAAESVGYPPLPLEIDVIRAAMRQIAGDRTGARTAYDELAVAAEALGATQIRADARIGLASLDVEEKRAPEVIEASMKAARAAITAAGSPPLQVLQMDELDSLLAEARGDRDEAIAILTRIQPRYIERHSIPRATRVTERLARALYARNQGGDRVRAREVLAAESKRQRAEVGDQASAAAFLDKVRSELR